MKDLGKERGKIMKKSLLALLLGTMVLSGCGSSGHDTHNASATNTDKPPQIIDVKIELPKAKLNEAVEIACIVTQGTEKVNDADEVKFEVRKTGADKSVTLESTFVSNGKYTATTTFKEDGTYNITAHVTARHMHNMPTVQLTVGDKKAVKKNDDDKKSTVKTKENGDDHHEHGMLTIQPASHTFSQKATLRATVLHMDEAFSKASVQFEVWQGDKKHIYIPAVEVKSGTYEGNYTFSDSGKMQMKVHVLRGDVHEHKVFDITVK